MISENTPKEKKWSLFHSVFLMVVLIAVATVIVFFPSLFQKEVKVSAEFSAVDKICELATLKCYYHNVMEGEQEPDGLFKYGLFKFGYKKFWVEYNGIVKVGIDFNDVVISEPNENGEIRIFIPKAKVLDVDIDEESISEPIVSTGVFTNITAEDQSNALSQAQINMDESARSDASILKAARQNAKELIKQYVINVGKQIGQEYTVVWVED